MNRELVGMGERDGGLEILQLRLCEERAGWTGRERWGTGKTATETVNRELVRLGERDGGLE